MSSSFFEALPLEQQRLLDRLCDEFEQAWANGQRPSMESFLEQFPEPHRAALLPELIGLEVELRRRRHEQPSCAEYIAQFPSRADDIAALSCFGSRLASPAPDVSEQAARETPSETGDLQQQRTVAYAAEAASRGETSAVSIGSIIGSYRVLEKLGQGGMGEVYRVAHELIDCQRALKVLQRQLAAHPEAVQRFLREAQASVRHLIHPQLVTVFDVSRDQDTVYLVMELVDGVDLWRLVQEHGPLAPRRAAELIRQAASGLQFAHQHGYVHRDIKPHNLMVTSRDEVKILDLGLVRVLDGPESDVPAEPFDVHDAEPDVQQSLSFLRTRLTNDRALLGTLPYMAPEQAADPRRADAQSDIYSLGCTLYYLLTGRHAFGGRTAEEILHHHLSGTMTPLADVRTDVPADLEAIMLRMLHRDRTRRYGSAAEVQAALQSWLEGGPLRVRLSNADELQRGLVQLGLISEDDWQTPISEIHRRPTSLSSTMVMSSAESHPAIILQKLQELQSSRGGQKYGLSEFQVRTILNENADLLRLPRHVLLDKIGAGWKGEIYKARNLNANRTEVVRVFPLQSLLGLGSGSEQRAAAFQRHVAQLQQMEDPRLARTYEGERFRHRVHGDMVFLASEYIVGESLETFVMGRFNAPARWPRMGWIVEQWEALARSLDRMHPRLLHLDITNLTLRIDREDRLRLADCGVAVMLREPPEEPDSWRLLEREESRPRSARSAPLWTASSRTESIRPQLVSVGSPEVQAPELLRNPRDTSPAADFYSYGCSLFFLLTGTYPFPDDGSTSALLGHLTRSPWEMPAARRVPGCLRPVLERLLAKEPSSRYDSGGQLAEDFVRLRAAKGFVADEPVHWSLELHSESSGAASAAADKSRWWQRLFGSFRRTGNAEK